MTIMTPDETIPLLIAACPEFPKTMDISGEAEFSTLGFFGSYLGDGIVNKTISSEEIDRAFAVFNDMAASPHGDVHEQLMLGVLEVLSDEDEAIEMARNKLKGPALEMLDAVLKFWYDK